MSPRSSPRSAELPRFSCWRFSLWLLQWELADILSLLTLVAVESKCCKLGTDSIQITVLDWAHQGVNIVSLFAQNFQLLHFFKFPLHLCITFLTHTCTLVLSKILFEPVLGDKVQLPVWRLSFQLVFLLL